MNARSVFYQPDAPWSDLVERVRSGDSSAVEDLYTVFSTGIRLRLTRQLAAVDVNDKVHDLFVAVMESIREGKLRQPDRLMGYVHTIVNRQVASHIDRISRERRNPLACDLRRPLRDRAPDPEHTAIDREIGDGVLRVLRTMRPQHREILVRFYLREETPDEIRHAMCLNEGQYRVLKSRAKARLGVLYSRRVAQRRSAPAVKKPGA